MPTVGSMTTLPGALALPLGSCAQLQRCDRGSGTRRTSSCAEMARKGPAPTPSTCTVMIRLLIFKRAGLRCGLGRAMGDGRFAIRDSNCNSLWAAACDTSPALARDALSCNVRTSWPPGRSPLLIWRSDCRSPRSGAGRPSAAARRSPASDAATPFRATTGDVTVRRPVDHADED